MTETESELVQRLERYVIHSFANKDKSEDRIKHLLRTAYWIRILEPDAEEAKILAAIGHDLERAFRNQDEQYDYKKMGFRNDDYLEKHQLESARVVADFLRVEGADPHTVEKVNHLISSHESGGDDDQNLIKDADSISFLENKVDNFIKKHVDISGKENVKEKIVWMYERISSEQAKRIAKPIYEKAIKKLENN